MGRSIQEDEGLDCRKFVPERVHQAEKLFLQKKHFGPGIVQDVDELLRGQPHIQRKEHGTGFENTVVGFEQPVAIHAEKCNAVPWLDNGILQRTAQPGGTVRKFRVRKSLVPAHYGSPMRILLFGVSQAPQRCERDVHGVARPGLGGLPSVHYQDMSSDIVRCARRKKHGSTFQIVVIAEAAQRNLIQKSFFVSFHDYL